MGDTTTRAAVLRLDRDVRRHHPDLVIVQFGINDSWIDVDEGQRLPRLSRSEFRKNLTTIVRRLKRDGSLVVLMTPNPMRWSDPYYIKAFSENPGLLDVGQVRGIDRLLDVYAQDVRDVAKSEATASIRTRPDSDSSARCSPAVSPPVAARSPAALGSLP